MSIFTERIASVQTPVVNDNGPGVPAIWWHNGNKQAKTPGVFYLKAATLQSEPEAPWQLSERFEREAGFETPALHLALVTWRQQPYRTSEVVIGGEKRKERCYLAAWEPGAQIHTEIVCLAEGIAEPVIWSFHGMAGRAVMSKNGIVSEYRNGLLHTAERAAGKRLPLWTFWLPLSSLRDAKGQLIYTDTGHGSVVTLPMVNWPAHAEAELLDTFFVGEEWLASGYDIHAQFAHWRTQRRGDAARTVNGSTVNAAAPSLPDNASFYEDDDDTAA